MQQGFARTGHARRQRQQVQHEGIRGVVLCNPPITPHPGKVIKIAGLGHTGDRQQQKIGIGIAHGIHGHFKLGAVNGVAGHKYRHSRPAEFFEIRANFSRGHAQLLKIRMQRRA